MTNREWLYMLAHENPERLHGWFESERPVMCRECANLDGRWCRRHAMNVGPNDYCSWGETEDGE